MVKCRAQHDYVPIFDLGEKIPVPTRESHLMHARILERFGVMPSTDGETTVSAEDEDAAALDAMEQAANMKRPESATPTLPFPKKKGV